ncbi:class I SAM-dependent methyltransferase [Enterococcus sp. LJL90]
MELEKIETAFNQMEAAVSALAENLELSFLEAYSETVENFNDNFQVRVIDNQPSPEVVAILETAYANLKKLDLSAEEWRQVFQLVLLKGLQKEPLQANHQLTPDSIGFLFVFLVQQLLPQENLRLLDIASGLGNLLLTVVSNLETAGKKITVFGVDIDETLLSVAAANTDFLKKSVAYFHQDALQDLLVDPVDAVFGDLPIGYYPNDQKAQEFTVGVKEGHTFAHHLLLEQSMKYVREAGFGLFLLPTNFLETEQGPQLKNWLANEVYLQGMIQLPADLFTSANSRKSIVILQKRGTGAKQAEVLLANLGSLKNAESMTEFIEKFKDWESLNL